jgi:hypothetical protein
MDACTMRFFSKLRNTSVNPTSSTKETASMIRSSLVARWALGLVVLLAGSASLPAVDLYVTGFENSAQKNVFGKIDSATGVYSQLNSDIGGGFDFTTGLAWNPNISQFNTLRQDGTYSSITTTGTVGSVIASGLIPFAGLAYNPASSTMYSVKWSSLNSVNPATGAESNIGNPGLNSVYGITFINGTMYGTVQNKTGPSGSDYDYGSFNLGTGAFTAIVANNSAYDTMRLAYDGTTLFGLRSGSLYTLNPTTGAYTTLTAVTGLGTVSIRAMSVPVAVPEPSTYALAAIATGVMAAIARRRKARRA